MFLLLCEDFRYTTNNRILILEDPSTATEAGKESTEKRRNDRKTILQSSSPFCKGRCLTSPKQCTIFQGKSFKNYHMFEFPRDPITLSVDDWGIQSPPQQSI